MNILLAVDGSTYSRRAARLLTRLPVNEEPRITVLHVFDSAALAQPLPLSPLAALKYGRLMRDELQRQQRAADRLAAGMARRLAARWPRTKGVVVRGDPAEQIIARAKREKSDLILIGSRGLSDIRSFLLGSVSHKVVAHAPCPVLVVRAVRPSITTWLLAVDGSASSEAAMRWMARHWTPGRLRGTALYVWDYPLPPHPAGLPLQMVTDRYVTPLRRAGFTVAPKVVMGHAADQIVTTARRMRADLVVIGSRGLTGLRRVWMGGVSHQVVKHASTSVLVVR
ncbi:MAG TPA: universal stress protein [Nitrospiria bacterium]|nr:universal stress protein [Nitrospiria bacterium]